MNISKTASSALNRISNSKFCNSLSEKVDNFSTQAGKGLCNFLEKSPKGDKFQKIIEAFEPNGNDNSWPLMLGIMMSVVLGPRVMTAAKRNPDDKEATKDEIKEILQRDVQTIAIILLLLKILNTTIGSAAGKFNGGLPMTNKKYEELFEASGLNGKLKEFKEKPIKILKSLGHNILDTINPMGGKTMLTNEQFVKKHSNFENIREIKAMFDDIEYRGGNKEKIFDEVMGYIIEDHKEMYSQAKTRKTAGENINLEKLEENLEILKNSRNKGVEILEDENLDECTKNYLKKFFENPDNKLVNKARGLNAWLRSIAYAIEIIYLGFGLPFLNQKRLEKKYLSENENKPVQSLDQTVSNDTGNSLINKNINQDEKNRFKMFMN